jgi:hypothetical protein
MPCNREGRTASHCSASGQANEALVDESERALTNPQGCSPADGAAYDAHLSDPGRIPSIRFQQPIRCTPDGNHEVSSLHSDHQDVPEAKQQLTGHCFYRMEELLD